MINISYNIHSLLKQRWSTYHTTYIAYLNKGGQHIKKTYIIYLNKGGQHIIQHTQLTKTKVVNISYSIHSLLKQRWSTYHTTYIAYLTKVVNISYSIHSLLNKGGQHIIQHTQLTKQR